MKITRYLRLAVLAVTVFAGCSREVETSNENVRPEIVVQAYDKLMRVNESSIISVAMEAEARQDITVSWWTDNGRLDAVGSSMMYTAPDSAGIAVIKMVVRDRTHQVYSDSTIIRIYSQLVFLKADDLDYDRVNIISPRWQRFIGIIKKKKIKANMGLIGTSLEKGNSDYIAAVKQLAKNGRFEIWNHGYDHVLQQVSDAGEVYSEFQNSAFAYQKDHLLRTQRLAKSKLGMVIHTFGAPGNRIDVNTKTALDDIADIKVWYYGLPDPPRLVLKRMGELEFPAGNPDFEQFIARYQPENDYIVLQLHPNMWNDEQFAEFEKTIDFLIKQQVTFINPYEYYQLKQ